MRISSPPYRWPCFYGMDTGTRGELLAANLTVEEIQDYLGVDTLSYLSIDRLHEATGAPQRRVLLGVPDGRVPGRDPGIAVEGRARVAGNPACPRIAHHRALRRRRGRAAVGAGAGRELTVSGETYAAAGVDIAAGEAAVDRIKGIVRSTYRPEVVGDIGGFGGLFDMTRHRWQSSRCWCRPPTVWAPRPWSPPRPAASTPIGLDLVRCAWTTSSARAPSRCSSSTTSRSVGSTPTTSSRPGRRRGRWLPPGHGVRADRWRDGRTSRARWRTASSTSSASLWARSTARPSSPARTSAPATCSSGCTRPGFAATATRWRDA